MSDWEKRIGFADHYGTTTEIAFEQDGGDGETCITVWLGVGQCGGRGYPTAEAARQIAAALLDAADAMEKVKA